MDYWPTSYFGHGNPGFQTLSDEEDMEDFRSEKSVQSGKVRGVVSQRGEVMGVASERGEVMGVASERGGWPRGGGRERGEVRAWR